MLVLFFFPTKDSAHSIFSHYDHESFNMYFCGAKSYYLLLLIFAYQV
jgi:hypothetical protein